MKKSLVILLILSMVVFLSAGCGRVAQKAAEEAVEKQIESETGQDVEIDTDQGKVKIETEEGSAEIEVGEGVSLPDNFPEDFPIYKGAKATGSFSASDSEGKGVTVTFMVDANVDDVKNFYKEELPAAGYNINATIDMGGSVQYYFINEDKDIEGVVQVMKQDGQTGISVTMGF